MTEDLMISFWNKYEEDELTKEEVLAPIVNRIKELINSDMDEELKTQTLSMALRSYFDDLLEYCWREK